MASSFLSISGSIDAMLISSFCVGAAASGSIFICASSSLISWSLVIIPGKLSVYLSFKPVTSKRNFVSLVLRSIVSSSAGPYDGSTPTALNFLLILMIVASSFLSCCSTNFFVLLASWILRSQFFSMNTCATTSAVSLALTGSASIAEITRRSVPSLFSAVILPLKEATISSTFSSPISGVISPRRVPTSSSML